MDGYKHYIRTDANGIVIKGFTSGFLVESGGTEELLSGDLQLTGYDSRQFEMNLMNERMQYKYKVADGQMVERTQQELDTEWSARPTPPPSDSDRLKAAEDLLKEILLG